MTVTGVIIFNVRESNRETMEELETKVMEIIDSKINSRVDLSQMDFTKRLGRNIGKRPILVRFISYRNKIKVSKLLKGTSIGITEDFPPEIREERRKLLPYLKLARDSGKKATLRYNKLIVD